MLNIKDLPLEERKAPLYREHHLTLALLMLLGFSVLPSTHRGLGAIQAFSGLLSVPVLSLLFGRMSRGLEKSLRSDRLSAVGLAALYSVSTLPGFWMAALARKEAVFDLLSPASATGLFLFCSLALPAAVLLEEKKYPKKLLLPLSVLLGLAVGYLPGPANPLGLRQLVSFLPLFLVGRWVNPEALEALLKRLWLKIAGVVTLLALLAFSFWRWKRLLDWGLIFMAGDAYGSVGSFPGRLGAAVRLAQYVAALLAAAGALSLCPNRSLGPVSRLSQRWYSGLFWHQGTAFFLAAVPFFRRGLAMTLLRTALMGLAPLVCCIPLAAVLPNWLLDLPQHLQDEHAILKIKRRRRNSLHFVLYCLVFLLLLSQYTSSFVETGHTMTWVPDGENLYMVMMYYSRNYFVNVFKTLLRTHRLVFPQWDFSIGQGASVLSVLRFNPFYLLSFLFPRRWMDYAYALYSMLQLFCTALAFSALCRRLGQKDELTIFTGSLIYTFSGYSLFTATKHVYYITYLVLALPLLLLGCERFLQDKKWGLFVSVVTLLFLGSYYYAWMDGLLMGIYLLAREIYLHKDDWRKIVFDLVRLVALFLWGLAMAMATVLPSLVSLFTSSRSDSLGNGAALFFSPTHYRKLLVYFVNLDPTAQNWTRLGFVGTVLLAVIVLFLRRRRWELRPFKAVLGLFTLFLCLPVVGSVFNGFGYATNRWTYGLALLMALIFVWMLPEMVHLSTKDQQIVTAVVLVYSVLVLVLDHSSTTVYSILLLLLLTLVLLMVNRLPDRRLGQQLLAGATVAALMVHVGFFFSPGGLNNVEDYTELGSGARKYSSSAEAALTGLEKDLYRGEHNGNRHNTFCLTGGNGTSTYWSVLDNNMVEYHLDFELESLHQTYSIWGLDQRASLCALAGVKYYTSKTPDQVPFGFEDAGKAPHTKHTLFKNKYALPFGYTYTSYMTREEYDQLSALEKQQAILQNAVVEEETPALTTTLAKGEPKLNLIPVPWEAGEAKGVELEDNSFHVTKKDGTITLRFQGRPGCETYLWLKGARYLKGASESTVKVQGKGGGEKNSDFYQENTLYYFDRSGYTYNLGYSDEAMTECTLTFEQKGWYSAEDIQIVCLPMKDYVRDVTALGEVVLEDARETPTGGLSGHIELTDSRLLALSVPCSKGWRLYLNGEKASLMRLNGMYMGALLAPGSYDVELRYTTPGLRLGAAVSALALLVLAAHGILYLIQRKKR